jgi:UPF0755 protein
MRKILPLLLILITLCACLYLVTFTIPSQAEHMYGPPASWLTLSQRVEYSAKLLWYDGLLTRPLNLGGGEQNFIIDSGESVNSVAIRLQATGLIRDSESFRDYLIYSGLDTSIQSGEYQLSPSLSAIDIARELQDATASEVTFVILPGWRMEEIAASLPTSGLPIDPEQFLTLTQAPHSDFDFLAGAASVEGFLYPDSYIFARSTSVTELVNTFIRNFAQRLLPEMITGFERQGLTTYQAVILASVVEREAVRDEEKPFIASVYLNRLRISMKLEADPTVQYAIGFNPLQNTWWTNPLSLSDLQFDSPFNTYVYAGLPPAPIANPDFDSLQAVAFPAETAYYFFRAKCDGSGYHDFAETFEEHLGNGCQ